MSERSIAVSVSLFKGVCCHANVVLYAVCVACDSICLVYLCTFNSLAFFLQWACVPSPTVATVCVFALSGGFS
jgi:hypothetical protein